MGTTRSFVIASYTFVSSILGATEQATVRLGGASRPMI